MPRKKRAIETTYHEWEGDACRWHRLPNGDQTADLYRGGKGIVPTDASNLFYKAIQISRAR